MVTKSPLGPILDWQSRHDPASRGFRTLAAEEEPRSYTWACPTYLDQGAEGACVGHGWAHEIACKPLPLFVTSPLAFSIYRAAQKIDEWAGEDYSGTSVLAGAKAAKALGYVGEYRWAFGLRDALATISRRGPVVIGVNWYSGMFRPGADGFIRKTGALEGGHCVLVRGVNVPKRTVLVHNSWGRDWGFGGTALLTWDDFGALLAENGECCVVSQRTRPVAA
jgi:hypothetical protein